MRRASVIAPALRRGEPVSLGAARSRSPRGDPPRRHGAARRSASNSSSGCRSTAGTRRSSRRSSLPARRRATPRADDVPRPHAAAPGRGDARRFRRQCQPRIAHAAGRAVRLHRDAAGAGARRHGRARALPAIMQAQANRMARLIDDLLSLSRIELNAHLRPDKEVDLVADRAPGRRRLADAGARPRRRGARDGAAERLMVRGDRDELAARVREPGRERAEICGAPASASIFRSRGRGERASARRASRCAITVPASRPSTCRG